MRWANFVVAWKAARLVGSSAESKVASKAVGLAEKMAEKSGKHLVQSLESLTGSHWDLQLVSVHS